MGSGQEAFVAASPLLGLVGTGLGSLRISVENEVIHQSFVVGFLVRQPQGGMPAAGHSFASLGRLLTLL